MNKIEMLRFLVSDAEASVEAAHKAKTLAYNAYYAADQSLSKAEYMLHFARQQLLEAANADEEVQL